MLPLSSPNQFLFGFTHAIITKKLQCFFPQYVARQIRTPLFILNAAYDSWQVDYLFVTTRRTDLSANVSVLNNLTSTFNLSQIKNILAPRAADPYGKWQSCQLDIKNCQPNQLKVMQGWPQNQQESDF